ncbi:MAG: methylmalonyl-CoA carboxyltransferase [Bdellovibrionales bacterium RIFOXYB1_FULL_37_110]|nr:MAG: methylmalonyl-CoA carboxyltransferase [Bdellovibrionales bacterium RIFOXYC1_FULL_37_79]OFZ59839.1 MAG: methylmalonyl-CoA carboxyltransferase [Bdellovibrionales bacterium RIFOXYB1_FULL_37_110]OFZ65453.1 MAG: methylmalonyl-CoA carboxyltransferase [Bdellovibrionales bacterium RIFOXYD1_FULL_36_51]OFZ66517.1 MAG: methylmalonyl-CoA carboxyltransferase [Bdellovibrionales bacterium RIFOXYB2_FULL_36_6]
MDKEIRQNELRDLKMKAMLGGGQDKIDKHHEKGRLTARERIEMLLDSGSFEEFDAFRTHNCTDFNMSESKILGDGVVVGYGTINGKTVYIFAHDFTTFGGSLSKVLSEKVCKIMCLAEKNGAPIIGLYDSGGARIQEGIDSLAGVSEVFFKNVMLSGVVPQISVIFGPCAGAAVYSPALTDFVVMIRNNSYMFLTGPKVVKTVTHENVTTEELGGADVHATKSGLVHYSAESESDAIEYIKKILDHIPPNNMEHPETIECHDPFDRAEESLDYLIPDNQMQTYDMKEVIHKTVDNGEFVEIHGDFAKNIIVGFARYGGRSVGIVANQPLHLAGVLDINSSVKGARFIRFCDCFNIPIVTFTDVPGFLPGTQQEYAGVIRNGAKMIYAYAEATVPKICVVTRKAYGGAYCVMSSKHLRGDINYAWPTAEIAVMGEKGAVEILYAKESKNVENPGAFLKTKEEEYKDIMLSPYPAANKGYIDDIIGPSKTRIRIIKALKLLENKRDTNPSKKHGNIPL